MTTNWDLYNEVKSLPGGTPSILDYVTDTEWQHWRDFPATSEDGRDATVWAMRMPAQFFRLTTGDIEITTGSGGEMAELMLKLAAAIADGMIGFSFTRHA